MEQHVYSPASQGPNRINRVTVYASSSNALDEEYYDAASRLGTVLGEAGMDIVYGGGGDDIITVDQFDNFELKLEWKIVDRAGNSGIIIRASEDAVTSWHTGPEIQVLDNAAYPNRDTSQLAGAHLHPFYLRRCDRFGAKE